MEKEIQNTMKQVSQDKYESEKEPEEPVELNETELEKYRVCSGRSKKRKQALQ